MNEETPVWSSLMVVLDGMKEKGEECMQEDKWDNNDVVEAGVRIQRDELGGLVESKEFIVSSI